MLTPGTRALERRRSRHPKVNWGKGQLLPYESSASFFAKFCLLNGLRPVAAKKFIEAVCYPDQWSPDGVKPTAISILTRLLDENISIVRTLYRYQLDLVTCYGSTGQNVYLDWLINHEKNWYHLTYCPDCIRMGYHASFHEYAWLAKCPIHHCELVTDESFNSRNLDNFYEGVKRLISIMEAFCPRWLEIGAHHAVHQSLKSARFIEFRRWVKSAQKTGMDFNASHVFSLRGNDYSTNTLKLFWGRLSWKLPIPRNIALIVANPIHATHPTIKSLPKAPVSQLREVVSSIPFETLSRFYRMNTMFENNMPAYRIAAMTMLKLIKARHDTSHCRCSWGRAHDGHWWRRDPDRGPNFSITCPVEIVMEEIQVGWIDFRTDFSARLSRDIWQEYYSYCQHLIQLGYGRRIEGKYDYLHPLVQLTFTPELIELIEELLFYEFRDHLHDLDGWLKQIDAGTEPFLIPGALVRSNVFLNQEEAYLLHWNA